MVTRRCKLNAVLALILALASGLAAAAGVAVPRTQDLQADGARAGQRHLPILLVFAATDCSYCKVLDREILQPMLLSGAYRDKVVMRQVMMDDDPGLRDFNGRQVGGAALAAHYHVRVTPTVLLVDSRGRELAQRIVGISTVDLYGAYLDQAIDEALGRLRDGASADRAAVSATPRS